MSIETWNAIFQWGSVALIAVTFIFGAGALWTGNRVNERQTARILTLERDLAGAKTILATQQERAANAERALLELQGRARPRVLDDAAKAAIRLVLSQQVETEPIHVTYVGGSTNEPGPLAYSLAAVLRSAGWNVDGPSGGPWTGTPPTGVLIRVAELADVPKRASTLEAALAAGGLSPRTIRAKPIKPGDVELLIGLKP